MSKERIQYIDFAKGLGIFLIVIGHCILPFNLHDAIFSFHVPLFFIISGFFIKPFSKVEVIKTARLLLVPMYFTTLIAVFLLLLMNTHNGTYVGPGFLRIVSRYVFCRHFGVCGLWFLFALFWGKLLFQIIKKYLPKYSFVVSLALFIIAYLFPSYIKIADLPFYISQSFSCVIFLYAGYIIHEKDILGVVTDFRSLIISTIVVLFAYLVPMNMVISQFPLGIFNVATSIILSLSILYISKYISEKNGFSTVVAFVNFYGRNTLLVLCLHGLIHFYFEQISFDVPVYVGICEILFIGVTIINIRRFWFIKELFNIR